jgi:hypothetical protein
MAFVLNCLPSELLSMVTSYFDSSIVLKLWLCGDSQLNMTMAARGGVKELKFDLVSGQTTKLPCFAINFTRLHYLSFKLVKSIMHLPMRDSNFVQLSPHLRKLELLGLSTSCLLSNNNERPPSPNDPLSGSYHDLSTMFPNMETLIIADAVEIYPKFFFVLPPHLSLLSVTGPIYPISAITFNILPRTLSHLTICSFRNAVFRLKQGIAVFTITDLPQSYVTARFGHVSFAQVEPPPQLTTLNVNLSCCPTLLPNLPPSIITLDITNLNLHREPPSLDHLPNLTCLRLIVPNFLPKPFFWVPRSVTSLSISGEYFNISDSDVISLPNKLQIYQGTEFANFPENDFHLLPRSLTSFSDHNPRRIDTEKALKALPETISHLDFFTPLKDQSLEILQKFPLLHLTLSTINGKHSSLAFLPRTLQYLQIQTPLMGSSIRLLPHSLTLLHIRFYATEMTDFSLFKNLLDLTLIDDGQRQFDLPTRIPRIFLPESLEKLRLMVPNEVLHELLTNFKKYCPNQPLQDVKLKNKKDCNSSPTSSSNSKKISSTTSIINSSTILSPSRPECRLVELEIERIMANLSYKAEIDPTDEFFLSLPPSIKKLKISVSEGGWEGPSHPLSSSHIRLLPPDLTELFINGSSCKLTNDDMKMLPRRLRFCLLPESQDIDKSCIPSLPSSLISLNVGSLLIFG